LATNQDYFADKLSIAVMMGPVTNIAHNSSKVFHFAGLFYDQLDDAVSLFGIHELLGANWFTSGASALFCGHVA